MNYYEQNIEEVLRDLETTKNGLNNSEALVRLKKYGANNLPRSVEKITRLKIYKSGWRLNRLSASLVCLYTVCPANCPAKKLSRLSGGTFLF